MAGPTPVSALIHAATMVTAGVYLVARASFLFVLSPAAMATIAVVGALTAVFAATIGLLQTDLKKVLAYSTVSQLGYMFIGVGVGAFSAGFFHVFTHAFFKACLFLGAGSVIHAMHARIHDTDASQDMRNMGGMAKYMPITRWTFLISCFSIAGLPILGAGFWSKDEILWKAFSTDIRGPALSENAPEMWQWPPWLGTALFAAGVIGAAMTAFYMFRAYFLTFHGKFRGWTIVRGWKAPAGDHHHDEHEEHESRPLEGPRPKESAWPMTGPLAVLAGMAVLAGFLGAEPLEHYLHVPSAKLLHFLAPIFEHASQEVVMKEGVEDLLLVMMLPGIAAFAIGLGGAYAVYYVGGGKQEEAFKRSFPGVYRLVYDKWRIDELYEATVLGMVDALADIFNMADRWIVDGIIARLTAAVVAAAGSILRTFQTGRVQVYAAAMVLGLFGLGWHFVTPQAAVQIDESDVNKTGAYAIEAAPGLGYTYRWEAKDVKTKDEFEATSKLHVPVAPGETKEVKLEVRNAIGFTAETTVTLSRPAPQARAGGAPAAVVPAGQPVPAARPAARPGARPAARPGARPTPARPSGGAR